MTASPIDSIRAFERDNVGNVLILCLKEVGANAADDWIVRYPPPWTEDMVKAFMESIKLTVAVTVRDRIQTRSDRRFFRRHLETFQCVALLSGNDRIIEHSLSGFTGGTA